MELENKKYIDLFASWATFLSHAIRFDRRRDVGKATPAHYRQHFSYAAAS